MKNICVIGAEGFVGAAICKEIEKRSNFHLVKVTRHDEMKKMIEQSDIIIHSANSSRRFFANQNRSVDLFETIEKTLKILKYSKDKKIILVSTLSARAQQDTPYGAHRRACELLLDHKKDLIVRLGNMFGPHNTKGVLFDIINDKDVYASATTKCAFVDVRYNALKIVEMMLSETGLIELGAKNHIELGKIARTIGSRCKFVGVTDTQLPLDVPSDAPSVDLVFKFINKQLSEKK
jgi:nucleoside-diphosphate-sugar epimerase